MSMTREEAIKLLRDTPIDIRSTREDDIHTLYATAQMMAIDALRSVSREQDLEAENMELKKRIVNWRKYMAPTREKVEQVWRGCSWCNNESKKPENWECSLLNDDGFSVTVGSEVVWTNAEFCPVCGRPLTDEAVEMVMERLEALNEKD